MSMGMTVWSTATSDVAAGDREDPGNMFHREYEQHIAAKRVKDALVSCWKSDSPPHG